MQYKEYNPDSIIKCGLNWRFLTDSKLLWSQDSSSILTEVSKRNCARSVTFSQSWEYPCRGWFRWRYKGGLFQDRYGLTRKTLKGVHSVLFSANPYLNLSRMETSCAAIDICWNHISSPPPANFLLPTGQKIVRRWTKWSFRHWTRTLNIESQRRTTLKLKLESQQTSWKKQVRTHDSPEFSFPYGETVRALPRGKL